VPEDKFLLNKVEVSIDNPKISREEAKQFVRQKENYKILGFARFHLMLYNMSSKKKTEGWLKRIGEPPQVYDEALARRSEDQLKQYLNNKGYFLASVSSAANVKEKSRKINLKYSIGTKLLNCSEARVITIFRRTMCATWPTVPGAAAKWNSICLCAILG
jgi:hypothetical protein